MPLRSPVFGLLIFCGLFSETALASEYQPARIGEHDASLAKRIKFPDIAGDFTLYLRCEAKVFPAGSIEEIGCYSDAGVDEAFFHAVTVASESATVVPATVDGEQVAILMLFSVVFRQEDAQRIIAVVPNHGTNAKSLGMSYIAPQRYKRSYEYTPRTELGLLWIDATLNEMGEPTDIKYLKTKFTNKETQRFAKHYITKNLFIPGFVDGEPRSMRFVKPIFGYKNGFMWQTNHDKCTSSLINCDETSRTTGKPRYVFDD